MNTATSNVLLVEDGPAAMDLCGVILCDPDINLEVCTEGRTALDRLNADPKRFDLVILGTLLPEINVLECLAYIRRMFRRLPVLVLSDTDDPDLLQKLADLGIKKDQLLLKPISREAFAAQVNRVLPVGGSPRA